MTNRNIMTTNQHNEANYENTLIQLFQDLGYAYEQGYDVERDYSNPYYEEDLREALQRLNPMLSGPKQHDMAAEDWTSDDLG